METEGMVMVAVPHGEEGMVMVAVPHGEEGTVMVAKPHGNRRNGDEAFMEENVH